MKIFFAVFLVIVVGVCSLTGSTDINITSMTDIQSNIFWAIRVPRVLFAVVIGGMLGLSGSVYQLVLKNPLADSFTTGAASSSALGAVLAIALGFPVVLISPMALLTGLCGLMLVYRLSSSRGRVVSPVTMILAGVVLNIVASSVIGFTKFYFEESLSSIVFWLMGGFFIVSYQKISAGLSVLLVVYAYFYLRSGRLNLLSMDEYSAETAGVNVRVERMFAFVLSTLLVAVAVSFSGLIGFVGLIVPHVARSFFGSDMRTNIYYSTIFGGLLLVVSDAVARTVIPGGTELPVGIITAILGGFFFLYMLKRRRGQVWA
ncbi:transport system permease protein [Denitrovibrio acetiphilus DSM 12809]|uniref:Transport system permease protein n=1 Tax=Denitrovibrio acetiphilus (strain DSM 12809 / NBRC 114555 / N2460) TaxID=522772 RepID=D4H1Z5_DENA2|nr:iron ABC transporter permease [Denitrovibrio acetiphilus]ADD66972.1 transport system permease protein [Denitrovibrio acetiphilus DSM 12809]